MFLGVVVSGYRVHDGQWDEIGRISPQLPEMFYDVKNKNLTIESGDILVCTVPYVFDNNLLELTTETYFSYEKAARCTMQNNGGDPVRVGSTQKDEMCNFYVMYWVEGEHLPTDSYCFTEGPPNWSWSDFGDLDLDLVPDTASVLPGFEDVTGEDSLLLGATKQELEEVFLPPLIVVALFFSSEQPPLFSQLKIFR